MFTIPNLKPVEIWGTEGFAACPVSFPCFSSIQEVARKKNYKYFNF